MSKKPADVASKEKNEYIPSFISKKPFYLSTPDDESDYLEHQRLQNAAPEQSKWYDRGKKVGAAATKFRKGACENCGAMSHKTKDCLSRPRAKGAKWTGKDIQADEVIQNIELGWDAKRDRWNGYDPSEYRNVIEEYEELENLKKEMQGGNGGSSQNKQVTGDDDGRVREQEEAKYAEESDMGRHQSTATRNLRLREDTAKYLLNLDLESAKYDPKTRSMIDMGALTDQAAALVAEDNFLRASGDAAEFEKAQRYAWEAQERGDKDRIHLQANPTSGEISRRQKEGEAKAKRDSQRQLLMEKYGGSEYLQSSPLKNVAVTENEKYVEYDETGAVKGKTKALTKSKYPEDVLTNNHTSVWGSWWNNFRWGYACCHSTVKNSYCTGEAGKAAFKDAHEMRTGAGIDEMSPQLSANRSEQEALLITAAEDSRPILATPTDSKVEPAKKKRTLAEIQGGVSEEELESYKRSKAVANDPMAKLLGKDELIC
ncbi:MAG: hypothetical protein LQ351_006852 [Letrouitia transgressa]|nr:MAG: hypothetical protein LQ351_006852 [Letrouitia transgressa]